MKHLITSIALLFVVAITAQKRFIIDNVRLFDGESVQEDMTVLVEDGIITLVSAVRISNTKTKRIDGKGKTLMPALTNAHVHVWSQASLQEAAKAGVLNVLDMHGVEQMQGMLRSYKDSINYASLYAAGAAATAPGGHGTQFGFPSPTLTQPDEAKQFITDRVNANADFIKIIVEPWKNTLDHETVKALIAEAHLQNKKVGVHISKVEDGYQVLNNGADGLVHIWWDAIMEESKLQNLAKKRSQFVIPTLLTSVKATAMIKQRTPEAVFLSEDQLKSEVKRLYDAGLVILAGTDPPNVQINYGTDLYKELKLLSEAGIPNIDVLKGATSAISEAYNLEHKSYLKEGYRANMLLVNGNPLKNIEDISNIETIWKLGKEVKR